MGKHKKKQNSTWGTRLLAALALLLCAVLGFGVTYLLLNRGGAELPGTPPEQTEVQKNKNTISIPGYEGLTLKANTMRQELALKNPAENDCWFVITLYLEDGTELWQSDYIEPGKVSKPMRLNCELPAGNYSAVLKYACYRMDAEKSPLNGAETKLTLRVK